MANTVHGGQVNTNYALLEAARSGDLDLVKRLLDAGANKDFKDTDSVTPLHLAAEAGHFQVIDTLVTRGANRRAMDSYERLPGHAACHSGASEESSSILKMLFREIQADQGVRKTFRTCDGPPNLTTALHTLVAKGRADDVYWILTEGADPKATDQSGRTAWELACDEDIWSVVGAFVLHGHRSKSGAEWLRLSWYISELSVPNKKYIECTLAINSKVALYALLRKLIQQRGLSRDRLRRSLDIFYERSRGEEVLRPLEPVCLFEVSEELNGLVGASKSGTTTMNTTLFDVKASEDHDSAQPPQEQPESSRPPARSSTDRAPMKLEVKRQDAAVQTIPQIEIPRLRSPPMEVVPDFLSIVIPYFGTKDLLELSHERDPKGLVCAIKPQWTSCCCSSLRYFSFYQPWPLDEYCKSVVFEQKLAERSKRLEDQVIVRYQQEFLYGPDSTSQPVMVAQAWIWKIDDLLITGPSAFDYNGSRQSALLSHKVQGFDISTSIGILLSELINRLAAPIDDPKSRLGCGSSEETILDGFENMIALVFERVNNYIKEDGMEAIDVSKETEYLHRIHDVRDELSMIKRVLRQQEDVWRTFVRSAWPSFWTGGQDDTMSVSIRILHHADATARGLWKQIVRPQTQFREYQQRIAFLEEDADRIERAVQTMLDLKTKDATLEETHAVAQMNAAIFGFTIITIIFTPLAFVTALFALPIDKFLRAQVPSPSGSWMFTTDYIGKWFATAEIASVFVAVVAMWAALEFSLGGPVSKLLDKRRAKGAPKSRRRILELTSPIVAWVYSLSVRRQRRPDLEATGH